MNSGKPPITEVVRVAGPSTTDTALDHLNLLLRGIQSLDERGLVLALAAFAEDTLGILLINYMREPRQARELVEGFNAPLGTLATRIKAAFAMGLLTREQYDDLEILRRVRNAFAHDWQGVSLERDDLKAICGKLSGSSFGRSVQYDTVQKRLRETICCVLVELRVQIGQNDKEGRRIPFVGFRLLARDQPNC